MRIVMTYVVRDEADVLEVNLRVHRALGVDAFAVLDNGSTDGTGEILERWRAAGLAHVITDPDADTDEVFREWQTRLAKLAAAELGADWVINNDADEFWWPLTGDLRDAFGAMAPDAAGVLAPRLEFVPRPDGPEPWWERMTLRERHTRVLPKMAHRATEDVRVGPGSHHVISPSLGVGETAGKPSLRGLRSRPDQPALVAPANRFPCAIFHLPLRSFEQYRSRLGIGLRIARTRESERLEQRIRDVIGEETAAERWRELVGDEASMGAKLEAGELVEDTRLRDMLRAIGPPGPDAIEPPRYSVELAPEELERARGELTREALAGLTHNHAQALGERESALASVAAKQRRHAENRRRQRAKIKDLRRRLKRTRRRARAAQGRLERVKQSRWWRLRPRLPRRGRS
jgi:Glycosyl transferase family 2